MTLQSELSLAGYDAAIEGAAVYRVPAAGYLRIAGEDCAAYIQRQTTNDIHLLTPDTSLLTVLTSGTARILDVWRMLSVPNADAVDVITLPGRSAATGNYLQSRIFFMDKIELIDLSDQLAQLVLIGPESAQVLTSLGWEMPEQDAVLRRTLGNLPVTLLGPDNVINMAARLLVAAKYADRLIDELVAAGAAWLAPETADLLRIEAGLPGAAGELINEYTPLEANLDAAVSSSKGCYTGQEVIARQITYDKVVRRLAELWLDHPVTVGARVVVDGRSVGTITSAAISPRMGPLALAVLRRAYLDPGTKVSIIGNDAEPVSGIVVAPME